MGQVNYWSYSHSVNSWSVFNSTPVNLCATGGEKLGYAVGYGVTYLSEGAAKLVKLCFALLADVLSLPDRYNRSYQRSQLADRSSAAPSPWIRQGCAAAAPAYQTPYTTEEQGGVSACPSYTHTAAAARSVRSDGCPMDSAPRSNWPAAASESFPRSSARNITYFPSVRDTWQKPINSDPYGESPSQPIQDGAMTGHIIGRACLQLPSYVVARIVVCVIQIFAGAGDICASPYRLHLNHQEAKKAAGAAETLATADRQFEVAEADDQ
jgi:hypothetical protein